MTATPTTITGISQLTRHTREVITERGTVTLSGAQGIRKARRDKYGRTRYEVAPVEAPGWAHTNVVRLPEVAWKNHDGNKYLVNQLHEGDELGGLVTYHRTLGAVRKYLGVTEDL